MIFNLSRENITGRVCNLKYVFAVLVFIFNTIVGITPDVANASLTNSDLKSIIRGTEWYDPDDPCSTTSPAQKPSMVVNKNNLSEDQKIAQTFLVGFTAAQADTMKSLVEKYKIGGVFIVENNGNGLVFTKSLFDEINKNVGIPLIVASDEEGGTVQRFRDVVGEMPSALEMGSLPNDQVKAIAKDMGSKISANGVNTILAPTLDIDYPEVGSEAVHELKRTFGSDPAVISQKAGAFAEGLREAGLNPTYKHFPGLGSAPGDSDYEVTTSYDIDTLRSKDILPFQDLVNKHNGMVMLDGAKVPGLTKGLDVASTSKEAVDMLRNELKFNGIIMTDDLAAVGIEYSLPDAVVRSLKAGVDMPIFVADGGGGADVEESIKSSIDAVKSAGVNVDQQLDRILSYKGGVNTSVNTNTDVCCPSGSASVVNGSDNKAIIWNFFAQKGLSAPQIAGIMGNMQQESSLDPNSHQSGGPGYGLIQWGYDKPGEDQLQDWMKQAGIFGDHTSINTQLEMVWWHMNNRAPTSQKNMYGEGFSYSGRTFKAYRDIQDVEEATDTFEGSMERAGKPNMARRYQYAGQFLNEFGGGVSTPTPQQTPETNTEAPSAAGTVVLDPGHDGSDTETDDPSTGLHMTTTTNEKERSDMWKLSQDLKPKLEAMGYSVVLTKQSETDTVQHNQRALIANQANAKIAVSLHTDGSHAFGSWGEVYPQEVGRYREKSDGSKLEFSNSEIASTSQSYADQFVTARNKYENGVVVKTFNDSFMDRTTEGKSPGDISNVQLLSSVPWVYLEAGDLKSDEDLTNYSNGILDAFKVIGGAAVSGVAQSTCSPSPGNAQAIVDTALKLAWDTVLEDGKNNKEDAKPDYQTAKEQFNPSGDWSDCGVFVSTVMRMSGADPKYPLAGTTEYQKPYLQSQTDKYTILTSWTESDLRPGDIFIANGHTFIYIGQPNIMAVEASLGDRVPGIAKINIPTPETVYSGGRPGTGGGFIVARLR